MLWKIKIHNNRGRITVRVYDGNDNIAFGSSPKTLIEAVKWGCDVIRENS